MEINKSLNGVKGIYKLIIGNYVYVGSSKNIFRRLKQHRSKLKNNSHDNLYMQRVWNKYTPEFTFQILEICDNNITHEQLLTLEHKYIISEHANLNLKLDPETEKGCLTIIKKVYQFDYFGNFIKEWDSIINAAIEYNIDPSNITKVCNRVQQSAAGYLWDFSKIYSGPIIGIYVYDLSGKCIDTCNSTVEIFQKYFSDKSRKTVLSQLKAKIDSNIPYINLYLSHSKNFCVPNKNLWYKDSELNKIFESNPFIIKLDEFGDIMSKRKLSEYKGPRIRKDIINNPEKYKITNDAIYFTFVSYKARKLVAIKDNQEFHFNSIAELINTLFNKDKKLKSSIEHRIARKQLYNGWLIKWDCC